MRLVCDGCLWCLPCERHCIPNWILAYKRNRRYESRLPSPVHKQTRLDRAHHHTWERNSDRGRPRILCRWRSPRTCHSFDSSRMLRLCTRVPVDNKEPRRHKCTRNSCRESPRHRFVLPRTLQWGKPGWESFRSNWESHRRACHLLRDRLFRRTSRLHP